MVENSPPQYGRIIKEHVLMFAGIIIMVFGLMIVTGSIIGTDSEMSASAQLDLVLLVGVMPALLGGWMCFGHEAETAQARGVGKRDARLGGESRRAPDPCRASHVYPHKRAKGKQLVGALREAEGGYFENCGQRHVRI